MSPYNEGYRAYFDGYARIDNPYEDALDYSEWDQGWVNAMFDDELEYECV